MDIDRTNATISFSFEPKDWKWRNVEGFLDAFKRAVPAEMRSYDPTSKVWDFSKHYELTFNQLYDQYFVDRNQLALF